MDDYALDEECFITKFENHGPGTVTWAEGRIRGYRVQAKVYPEHALDPSYEIDRSRISKLWVQRIRDSEIVFNWDRGLDQPAADEETQDVVNIAVAELAAKV